LALNHDASILKEFLSLLRGSVTSHVVSAAYAAGSILAPLRAWQAVELRRFEANSWRPYREIWATA